MTIPTGVITMWSGSLTNIPTGWVVCDGNSDTPDLRKFFIYGAEIDGDVEITGGSATHSHSSPSLLENGHLHTVTANIGNQTSSTTGATTAGGITISPTHNHGGTISALADKSSLHTHTVGQSATADHTPAYYKLFYIMKT